MSQSPFVNVEQSYSLIALTLSMSGPALEGRLMIGPMSSPMSLNLGYSVF